jgi:hypothetical protein
MSYLAVHDVTRALQRLIHSQLVRNNSSAVVTLLPPGEELPAALGVNLYLYRVAENSFFRNQPWPGDRTRPASDQPALALQLFYLLTPLGTAPEEGSLEGDNAHTMLGLAMLTLHEHPILNDVHLPGFDADTELPDYLLNGFEQVKIYLAPTGLDELSKIWSTINQPYRLSAIYEVSLVQLTPTAAPPAGSGIVTYTNVDVRTLDPAHLTSLTPPTGALVRIAGGLVTPNELRIDGSGLLFPGATTVVRVGGRSVTVRSAPAPTPTTIVVALPTDLDAGPEAGVTVTRFGRTSAPLTLTVRPWLSELRPIRTALDPTQAADLRLNLKGVGLTNPQAVRLEAAGSVTNVVAFEPGGTDVQTTVTLPAALANGEYSVRLVLNDVANSASNVRTLMVLPLISHVAVALVPPISPPVSGDDVHEMTVTGARLSGADVRLIIDGVVYQVRDQSAATSFVYRLGRQLSLGIHTIAVNVDGFTSRSVELVV